MCSTTSNAEPPESRAYHVSRMLLDDGIYLLPRFLGRGVRDNQLRHGYVFFVLWASFN